MNEPDIAKIHSRLARFPKTRAEVSADLRRIYGDAYKYSREGRSLIASAALRIEKWMHRSVAAPSSWFPLLEIGAGTLNHLPFEALAGVYDVVEPDRSLYADKPGHERVRTFYHDIADIPLERQYKRIISVAVLEHVLTLPEMMARTALLLEEDGEFRNGIPSEGGLLWYLSWRFGTGLAFWLRFGVSYKEFQKSEHVNDSVEIEDIVRLFYGEVHICRYPLPFLHSSFYTGIVARNPRREAALRYLQTGRYEC